MSRLPSPGPSGGPSPEPSPLSSPGPSPVPAPLLSGGTAITRGAANKGAGIPVSVTIVRPFDAMARRRGEYGPARQIFDNNINIRHVVVALEPRRPRRLVTVEIYPPDSAGRNPRSGESRVVVFAGARGGAAGRRLELRRRGGGGASGRLLAASFPGLGLGVVGLLATRAGPVGRGDVGVGVGRDGRGGRGRSGLGRDAIGRGGRREAHPQAGDDQRDEEPEVDPEGRGETGADREAEPRGLPGRDAERGGRGGLADLH